MTEKETLHNDDLCKANGDPLNTSQFVIGRMPDQSQLHFVAYFRAQPQGSTKAFTVRGKTRLTSDNGKMYHYRRDVTQMALEMMSKLGLQRPMAAKDQPVSMVLEFYFERPKSAKRPAMTVKPDLDKIIRSTTDALTSVAYVDDAQVVEVSARKHYGVPERVEVSITLLTRSTESL